MVLIEDDKTGRSNIVHRSRGYSVGCVMMVAVLIAPFFAATAVAADQQFHNDDRVQALAQELTDVDDRGA